MRALICRHLEPALAKRWIAGMLDSLPFLVLALPFVAPRRRSEPRRPGPGLELAAIALSGAYHILLTAARGQTLGQMAVGIRVVDHRTGTLPSPGQAAARWALTVVPDGYSRLVPIPAQVDMSSGEGCSPIVLRALPGFLYTCALHAPALRGPLHRGLHDRVAGTVVVRDDAHAERG